MIESSVCVRCPADQRQTEAGSDVNHPGPQGEVQVKMPPIRVAGVTEPPRGLVHPGTPLLTMQT